MGSERQGFRDELVNPPNLLMLVYVELWRQVFVKEGLFILAMRGCATP